jgi:hypothetical protein
MLAVAGAGRGPGAQSTTAALVLARVALPDAMLALEPLQPPPRSTSGYSTAIGTPPCRCPSAHDCEQVGSCGLTVEVTVKVGFFFFFLLLRFSCLDFRSTESSTNLLLLLVPNAKYHTYAFVQNQGINYVYAQCVTICSVSVYYACTRNYSHLSSSLKPPCRAQRNSHPPRLRYREKVRRSVCRARLIGRCSPEKLFAWLLRHGERERERGLRTSKITK